MHKSLLSLTIFIAISCSKQPEVFRIGDAIDSVIEKCERAGLEQTELAMVTESGSELVFYMIDQSNYVIIRFDTKSGKVTGITKAYLGKGGRAEREEQYENVESYP